MDLLLELILLLAFAKLLGEFAERAGYPALLGEVLAGILLGPSLLNWVAYDGFIEAFSNIGIVILLFLSGTELSTRFFWENRTAAAAAASGGVAVPLLFGFALGRALSLTAIQAFCIGIALSITSIGISVRTLIELGRLHTRAGSIIVGAAVFDDIIGMILLGMLVSLKLQGTVDLADSALKLVLSIAFLVLMLTIGGRSLRWLLERSRRSILHEMTFTSSVLIALSAAYLSHLIGLHYAIGGFLSGLVLGGTIRRDRMLMDSIGDFSFGFFTTFFFASAGLLVHLAWDVLLSPIFLTLVVFAVGSKAIGGYLGSILFIKNRFEAIFVGIGLAPRGEIALVVMNFALSNGILGESLYSMLTMMTVATILLAPLMLKWVSHRGQHDAAFVSPM